MKVYINGPGHMTKIAAMPIYGTRYKIQEALFYVGFIITDNISN